MVDAAAIPAGNAPVFAGWNVWDVWQAADPDQGVLGAIWNAGISQEQLLKLWVENQVEDSALGANVSEPGFSGFLNAFEDITDVARLATPFAPERVRLALAHMPGTGQLAYLSTIRPSTTGPATPTRDWMAAIGPTTIAASGCSAGWLRRWRAAPTAAGGRISCTAMIGTPGWRRPTSRRPR